MYIGCKEVHVKSNIYSCFTGNVYLCIYAVPNIWSIFGGSMSRQVTETMHDDKGLYKKGGGGTAWMNACREAILKLLITESQSEQKNVELQSTHTISRLHVCHCSRGMCWVSKHTE